LEYCSNSCFIFKGLDQKEQNGEFDKLPKKEAALLRKEHDKLRQNLDGLKEMAQLPMLLFLLIQTREYCNS
jgi:small subunit ribosomal protein S2